MLARLRAAPGATAAAPGGGPKAHNIEITRAVTDGPGCRVIMLPSSLIGLPFTGKDNHRRWLAAQPDRVGIG
jgi:hypothetical protein